MDLKKYFNGEELESAKEVLIQFHDKILLSKIIKNTSAIVLGTYMLCNECGKSMVEKEKVKQLFIQMGRTSTEFDKTLYEISGKRKGKKALLNIEKSLVGLNFEGLTEVKKILGVVKNDGK